MKRMIAATLVALTMATGAFAQGIESTPLPLTASPGPGPQFALSILTDYFEKDQRGDKVAGVVLTTMGCAFFSVGLAGLGLSFEAPPSELYSDASGQMLMRGLSIGSAGAGLLLGGIGVGILAKPADAYKREYAYLYAETDPVVQEAIAYGVMKDIADEAKRGRIVGGLIGVATPLATAGGYAIVAAGTGDWTDFEDNVLGAMSWSLPSLVYGIINLATGKSSEERMLDSYRTMSSSYAGAGGSGERK